MADGYDPVQIEAKWQSYWAEEKTYEVDNDDPRAQGRKSAGAGKPNSRSAAGHNCGSGIQIDHYKFSLARTERVKSRPSIGVQARLV